MKAVVYREYGPPEVLQLREVQKPIPKKNEVLIKVHATPITFGEIKARNFTISPGEFWLPSVLWLPARVSFGLRKPRKQILGSELAGEIESVGNDVTRFGEGDQVFGFLGPSFGANAEYVCMQEDGVLALKPVNVNYEEAAAIPFNAITALVFIRDKGNIQIGEEVLINGASGGIGQYAVQLAKYYGAEVTGVCSTDKMEFVKSLGADHVIDYTCEDFTKNCKTYDVIFDTAVVTSYGSCKIALKQNGRYLLAVFGMREVGQMLWTTLTGSKRVICAMAPTRREDLDFIRELIETGKLRAVIDRTYPLEQIGEAHRYVESGQKTGNVVLTVVSNG